MKSLDLRHKLFAFLLVLLVFIVTFSSISSPVLAQETNEEEPEFFMGILILESQQQAILESIKKVKDLQLGNMVILHPMDQAWNLTLIEDAIREANNLGLYTIFETYNASDHHVRISPEQFATWKDQYPRLLGILVQEITGKQIDNKTWMDNSTGTIKTRLQAERAIIKNITSTMKLAEFKENGARIMLQENVVSYVSANTSYCDVFISKVFNAPNVELMIGLARGMVNTYNISDWGLWVDTWKEWTKPPADFTSNDIERALYEAWFYGAKYFFFEQGNFFGTFNRDWPNKQIILGTDGKLTEYGKAIQRFYTFLQNEKSIGYTQPDYHSPIAVMIGQSGWGGRGSDWGLWNQSAIQGDFDYQLLNIFYDGIGDNWQIGSAQVAKHITGLPLGMVDIISVYAPPAVMKQYEVIIGLGWCLMSDTLFRNIEDYVQDGGVFLSLLTFTHSNQTVDDLADPYAWTKNYGALFGIHVPTYTESGLDIKADVYLHEIIFTEDTFWSKWNGRTYSYQYEEGALASWFWKFKYFIWPSDDVRVIAWINLVGDKSSAFIIENRRGSGFTYIVNTRDPNSFPDGVLTDVLTDFIHYLCAYYVKPILYTPYPRAEYWLNHGQVDRTIFLSHDNSTVNQKFSYYIKPLKVGVDYNKNYVVFDYFNNQLYGITESPVYSLNLTLQTNECKLYVFLEDTGQPQIIHSDTILTPTPIFVNQTLKVALAAAEEAENTTRIFCSDYEQPNYILGVPFDLAQVYNASNKVLTIISNTNITVGWYNTTEYSMLSSSAILTEFSWNTSLGLLDISTKATTGQTGFIQVQTGDTKPYYFKVNGEAVSTWSYNASTGVVSAYYSFTKETAELSFGFKQIEIDRTFVSDHRADVGSVQTVGVHVAWMCNGSDLPRANVIVNDAEYVTNETGWISFDVSHNKVDRVVWNITGIRYGNLTDFAKSIDDPEIIWDRINVMDSIKINKIVQSDSFQSVWLTAEYEYDSILFDESNGAIFLNGEPMTWSSQNSRWEQDVTSDVIGLQLYAVTSVGDRFFGLTKVHNPDRSIEITWDKIGIPKIKFETMTLELSEIKIFPVYVYTENPVFNATVLVNGNVCSEIESGIYACEIRDWSPLQSIFVEVGYPEFERAERNLLNVHVSNMLLYVTIVLAGFISVTIIVSKRKQRSKKLEKSTLDL